MKAALFGYACFALGMGVQEIIYERIGVTEYAETEDEFVRVYVGAWAHHQIMTTPNYPLRFLLAFANTVWGAINVLIILFLPKVIALHHKEMVEDYVSRCRHNHNREDSVFDFTP